MRSTWWTEVHSAARCNSATDRHSATLPPPTTVLSGFIRLCVDHAPWEGIGHLPLAFWIKKAILEADPERSWKHTVTRPEPRSRHQTRMMLSVAEEVRDLPPQVGSGKGGVPADVQPRGHAEEDRGLHGVGVQSPLSWSLLDHRCTERRPDRLFQGALTYAAFVRCLERECLDPWAMPLLHGRSERSWGQMVTWNLWVGSDWIND